MATSRDTIERLLLQEGVTLSRSAIGFTAIPHNMVGYAAEFSCGTRNGAMVSMHDNLESRSAYQAVTEVGQCKCLHCFKRMGYFEKAEGRVPILMYARPCEEHQYHHPTACSVGQWFLSFASLERTYIHDPKGGLAVLWVDLAVLGQIDVQLLRQDNKEDRAAGIDAYAFCNKVGEIAKQFPELKPKVVMAHAHVAMAMKWEPYKFASLHEQVTVSTSAEIGVQTDAFVSPNGRSGHRRWGIIEEPDHEGSVEGMSCSLLKETTDGGVGYVLAPLPGLAVGGPVGDLAAGEVTVRGGKVTVPRRCDD